MHIVICIRKNKLKRQFLSSKRFKFTKKETKMKNCPKCGKMINQEDLICKFCGKSLIPSENIRLFEEWYNKGMGNCKVGNFLQAIKELVKALEYKFDDIETLINIGICYVKLSQYKNAIDYFKRAIHIDHNSYSGWFNYGISCLYFGELDVANESCKQLIRIDPENYRAKELMSSYFTLKELLSTIKLENSSYPLRIKDMLRNGMLLFFRGEIQQGIKLFIEIIQFNSTIAEAWMILGTLYLYANQLELALNSLEKAVRLNPNLEMAWSSMGAVYDKFSQYNKALECYNKSLNINPNYSKAWTNKGLALDMLNIFGEALKSYDKSISLNPYNPIVWVNKGELFKKLRVFDTAKECYEEAYKNNPYYEPAKGAIDSIKTEIAYAIPRFDSEGNKIRETVSDATDYCNCCGKKNYVRLERCEYCRNPMPPKIDFRRFSHERYGTANENAEEILKLAEQTDNESNKEKIIKGIEELTFEGEFEYVFEISGKFLKYNSTSIECWFWRGKALSALGKDIEALNCYIMATRLRNGWDIAMTNLMITQSILKDKESKLKIRKMDRKPQSIKIIVSAESWNAQGAYSQTMGQFEEALYCFEKSLFLNNNYSPAKKNKARVIALLKEENLYDFDKELKQKTLLEQLDKLSLQTIQDFESILGDKFEIVKELQNDKIFKLGRRLELVIENNQIKEIGIFNWPIERVPESISNLTHLKNFTCINSFGKSFGKSLTLPISFGKSFNKSFGKSLTLPISFGKLKDLTKLNLRGNKFEVISMISGLSELINLEILTFSSNGIKKIEGLDTLKNLKKLYLHSNKIKEIEGLDSLTNIETLELESNKIEKIKGLNNLKNLSNLGINYNALKKIEGLEHLDNLRTISIFGNKDIENLIKEIGKDGVQDDGPKFVDYCRSKYIEENGLDNDFVVVNGKKFYVWNKKLRLFKLNINSKDEIQRFDQLHDLKEIDFSNNNLTKIPRLEHLNSLQILKLSNNQIQEIENLTSLTNLRILNLSSNKIRNIKNLEPLISLEELQLGFNEITEVNGLDSLVKLKKLHLNHNKIENVKGLGNLKELDHLSLHANWEFVKKKIGNDKFQEMGIQHNGYLVENPKKVVEYCFNLLK